MPRGSRPGERRGGRTAGTPNKVTAQVKEALMLAFENIGGSEAFAAWAKKNPGEFYKLWARLAPTEVSGPDGGGIPLNAVLVLPPEVGS